MKYATFRYDMVEVENSLKLSVESNDAISFQGLLLQLFPLYFPPLNTTEEYFKLLVSELEFLRLLYPGCSMVP